MIANRILELSYKYHLSHIGSCLTAASIIKEIYATKKRNEKFILSQGHAGLALYVVLEFYGYKAEKLYNFCGVHPDARHEAIDCSTGSLGQGIMIAVGMALADRAKNVYCLISDGEMAEGSTLEALRVAKENNLDNLKVYLNMNGWGATRPVDKGMIRRMIEAIGFPVDIRETNSDTEFCKGLDSHYYVLEKQDAEKIL